LKWGFFNGAFELYHFLPCLCILFVETFMDILKEMNEHVFALDLKVGSFFFSFPRFFLAAHMVEVIVVLLKRSHRNLNSVVGKSKTNKLGYLS